MMNFVYNGLIGVLVLAGDIWAILNIFQSSASNEKKLIWIIAVLLLPVLGLLLWYFLGPRNARSGKQDGRDNEKRAEFITNPSPSRCFLKYGKRHDGKPSVKCERKCGPLSCIGLLHRG